MKVALDLAGFTPVVIAVAIAAAATLIAARISIAKGGARLALRVTMWTMLAATAGVILVATIGFSVGDTQAGTRINIHPFVEIRRGLKSSASEMAIANVYGNIAMFLPIGLLLVWLWTSPLIARVIMATIAGTGLSLIIELTQLTLGRVADIDDVILNGSGALLGAVLAAVVVLLLRLAKWVRRRWRGRNSANTPGDSQ